MHGDGRIRWALAAVLAIAISLTLAPAAATGGHRRERRSRGSTAMTIRRRRPSTTRWGSSGTALPGRRTSWYSRRGRPRAPRTSARSPQLIASRTRDWQVWSVERRENLLEDHSILDRVKSGDATPQEFFDYYLGCLTNPSVTTTSQPSPTPTSLCTQLGHEGGGRRPAPRDRPGAPPRAPRRARRAFARRLDHDGLCDLGLQRSRGRKGPLRAGVLIDGGSGPATLTAEEATQRLAGPAAPSRRGLPSAASRARSPASSTSSARRSRSWTRTGRRPFRRGPCCRRT